jgi:hypothetical protein
MSSSSAPFCLRPGVPALCEEVDRTACDYFGASDCADPSTLWRGDDALCGRVLTHCPFGCEPGSPTVRAHCRDAPFPDGGGDAATDSRSPADMP